VAESLRELARLARVRGEKEVAEEYLRECLEIQQAVFDSQHPEIATTLYDLALVAKDRNLRAEALSQVQRAVLIFTKRLPMNHWRLVQARELMDALEAGE
jgi:protein-disulfide isomerase-like protein with CxxC motif